VFLGLKNDIIRKVPFYISDFRDAFSIQCVATYFFMYFACLTPIVTFGGLIGDATENQVWLKNELNEIPFDIPITLTQMAAMESLMSGVIVGVGYALFSGQPLTIMGSTGPMLVFEALIFDFCK